MRNNRWYILITIMVLCGGIAFAQAPGSGSGATALVRAFQGIKDSWFATMFPVAQKVFIALAGIEMAWAGTLIVLAGGDVHSVIGGLTRKVLVLGAMYSVLLFGSTWIPAVIDSFQQVGERASGLGPLSPATILWTGLQLMANLDRAGQDAGFFAHPGAAFSLELASILAFLSFLGICIVFVTVMIESYLVIGAGIIFLGFGSSSVTRPYTERYIGLAVAVGVKVMVIELIAGAVMQMSAGWLAAAAAIAQQQAPNVSGWEITGQALIALALAFNIPKFFSSVLGGAPSFSGAEIASVPMSMAAAGLTAAAGISAGGAAAAKMAGGQGMGQAVSAAAAVGGGAGGGAGGSQGGGSGPSGGGGYPLSSGVNGMNQVASGGAVPPPIAPGAGASVGGNGADASRAGVPPPPLRGVLAGVSSAFRQGATAAHLANGALPSGGVSAVPPPLNTKD